MGRLRSGLGGLAREAHDAVDRALLPGGVPAFGIATLAGAVKSALTKHQTVHVRILPGNHDSTIYLAVMFALSERYRADPRVIVHKEPSEFFLFEFGQQRFERHTAFRAASRPNLADFRVHPGRSSTKDGRQPINKWD